MTVLVVACGVLAGLASAGCEGLFAQPGQQVACNITGSVAGVDGGEVAQVDIGWFPEDELALSDGIIQGELDEDTAEFTITELTIAEGSDRVVGELGFGEIAIPPFPALYDQVRVAIDLDVQDCNEDLGVVELPLRGTTPVNNTENNTEADAGSNDDTGE